MLSRVHALRYLLWGSLLTLLLSSALFLVLPAQAQEPDVNPDVNPDAGSKLYLPVVAGGASAQAGDVIPGQYIVVLKDREARAAAGLMETEAAVADRLAAAYGGQVMYVYDAALSGFAVRLPDEAAVMLASDANVAYVEQDRVVTVPEPMGGDMIEDSQDSGAVEDDLSAAATDAITQSNPVWGLDRIDQRYPPLNSKYVYSVTTTGVHAYIIDTGILDTHTQFTGRIGNGFTAISDGNGSVDCNGHGTHVAGTVGGTTYGVAKRVTLHPVRVLGCGGNGSTAGVIAGINWVTANVVKPAVANMSLGGGLSFALRTAVERSVAAGVVYVVAAGNDDKDACQFSPANVPVAITVGATAVGDVRASFSNWGNCLDIFAPGAGIKSAWYTSASATNTISGTSMASPHVAGVIALYLKGKPTATPAQATSWLLAQATPGLVANAKNGSPNLFLYNGLPTPAPVACSNKVSNPGFESANSNWIRASTNALTLICNRTGCSTMPAPKSGSYLAWLGQDADSETSTITNSPSIALPAGAPARLSFWYAIDSQDSCGFDYGYVRVKSGATTTTIKTYQLCYENTSGAWQRQQIDLSSYAGQTIQLSFRTTSDTSLGSSLYLDNVQVVSGANCKLLAADEAQDIVEQPENGSGEDIVPNPK